MVAYSNKVVAFDGGTEYVTMGDVLGFERTDSFSYSFWLKTTLTSSVHVFSKMDVTASFRGITVYLIGSTGKLRLYLRSDHPTTNQLVVELDTPVNDGLWHHYVFTYAGTSLASGVVMYRDGVASATTTITDALTTTLVTSASFELGGCSSNGSYFTGSLDEVAVYNRVLTATEAAWIYNGGSPRDLSLTAAPLGLLAWWRMGEWANFPTLFDSGPSAVPNTVRDLSGNNYNGTMTSMETTDVVFDAPGRGQCLYCSGSDELQIASGGSVVAYDRFNKFSVSFWTRMPSGGGGPACSKVNVANQGWWAASYPSGVSLILNNTWTTNCIVVNAAASIDDYRWHHVVLTYDGSSTAAGVKAYVDGVAVTTSIGYDNLTASIIYSPTDVFKIGSVGAQYFTGRLRDLAIWGKELTAAQVAWIYNSGQPRELASVGSPEGLDGWWRLGNGDKFAEFYDSGPAVHSLYFQDNSFNNQQGQWYNMEASDIVYDAPGRGKSVLFDGVNEYVTMGDVLGFERTSAQSYSFWMKATGSSNRMLITKVGSAPLQRGLTIYLSNGSLTFLLANDAAGGDRIHLGTTETFNDGLWHHVAITYDGSSTSAGVEIRVDNVLRSVTVYTNSLTATVLNTSPFLLGTRSPLDAFYEGHLDEVAVYDKELSAAEVTWIYNAGVPRPLTDSGCPSNLQAWWRMGDGDTSPTLKDISGGAWVNPYPVILDATGNGKNGTMTYMESSDIVADSPGGTYSTKSLVFEGNEYVDCGDNFDFERTAAFSLSFWSKSSVKPPSGWYAGLLNKHPGGATSGWWWSYNSSGHPVFVLQDNTGAQVSVHPGVDCVDGTWRHLCVTYDGGSLATGLRMYINGSLAATGGWGPLTGTCVNATNMHIGTFGSQPYEPGYMDEVAIHSKELSAAEVQWIYNSGAPKALNIVGAPSNLVGWWRMGDDSLGFKGTMTNMESTDIVNCSPGGGFAQKSLQFDGVDEYISMGNVLGFEYTNSFSLMCWCKLDPSDADGALIAKQEHLTNVRGYSLTVLPSTDTIAVYLRNTVGTNQIVVSVSSAGINDGQWHHVAMTWDGNASPGAAGVNVYVDGVLRTTTIDANTLSATILNSQSFMIGARNAGDLFLTGKVTEAAVYNRSLTASEIAWIYNSGVPRDLKNTPGAPLNLVGWWRLGGSAYRSSSATGTWQTRILGDSPGLTSDFATKCLAFDGFSEYVDFGNVLAYERTQAFSISCWARWASTDYGALVAKCDGSYTGYILYKQPGGAIAVELQGSGGGYISRYSTVSLGNGAWHHIVMTYDGSSTRAGVKIWVDGVDVTGTTGADTLSTSIVTTAALRIGQRASDLSLTGEVDEVAIYNKQLTQAELQWIYNSGVPRDLRQIGAPSNLQLWARMGEGGYVGTMTNMESGDIQDESPAGFGGLGTALTSYLGEWGGSGGIWAPMGGGGAVVRYIKRARDLGSGPPPVYTEWVTTDKDGAPPTSPPVGPWGEIKIVGVLS